MLIGLLPVATAEGLQAETRSYTTYFGSLDATLTDPFPLVFLNGVDDLPYLRIEDMGKLLWLMNREWNDDPGYELTIHYNGPEVTLERDNGYTAVFDFEKDSRLEDHLERFTAARGDNWQAYEEVGNTAYVTFDGFDSLYRGEAFYAGLEDGEIPTDDTIGLIIYAHQQITRSGSPIENVVLDLSCNLGGAVDAAIFVLGWLLGDAPFSVKDMSTGAMSTSIYRADVNLDRKFDEADTISDKNLYCLISPVSFSCGNLVPAALKASQKVTLLGQTSGGGSCIVQPLSTAWGTVFQISSSLRMSFLKNGSFYDIDQGVSPDFYISRLSNFYDRQALTDYINSLY